MLSQPLIQMASLQQDRLLSHINKTKLASLNGGFMAMAKDLRSGMVLRRPLALSTAKMPSMLRSTCKEISFQTRMKTMLSQQHTAMDSLLQLNSILINHGGFMGMVRALKNGMLPKRLPASPTAKKSSIRK